MEKISKEKKLLNTFDIFSLGLGGAIGSGIFVMMGLGIMLTGKSVFFALICGAVLMMLAYMYNIVMSGMFNLSGGDYSQKKLLFGPIMTGVSGIFTMISGFGFAVYAKGIVDYLASVFPVIEGYKTILAILIMTLFFASTINGSKFLARIQNLMTIVLGLSILTFIVVGLPKVQTGFFTSEGFFNNGPSGFFQAISIMAFACMGTTMAPVAMSAVTKNPRKTIPKAIFLITIALGLLYALMSVVASGVLPFEEIAGQNLSVVALSIFPHPIYVIFILGGAVFALATSLLSGIAMLRYPIEQIAEDGWLPSVFKSKTKTGFPWMIQLTFYLVSTVPILFDFSFDALISFIMIPLMLISAVANYRCTKLPEKFPTQWKTSIFSALPIPVMKAILLLGVGADMLVAYNLFKMLDLKSMIIIVAILAVCVIVALIRLKTDAVNLDKINDELEEILKEIEGATV